MLDPPFCPTALIAHGVYIPVPPFSPKATLAMTWAMDLESLERLLRPYQPRPPNARQRLPEQLANATSNTTCVPQLLPTLPLLLSRLNQCVVWHSAQNPRVCRTLQQLILALDPADMSHALSRACSRASTPDLVHCLHRLWLNKQLSTT